MELDKENPFLKRNLERLEKRFQQRFLASVEKKVERKKEGKPVHQTVLKSIEENEKRILMVRLLKTALLEEAFNTEI